MIFSDLKLSYNISDMGYDNSLSKIVFGTPDIPPEMSNVFTSGVAAQVLTSGELIGNLTVKEGYIQSFNFVSGSEGWRILYNGTAQFAELTLTGGTLKYKKTSFTDSTHAGYYIGSEGIYFGSISDATKLKYTIADGSFTITGALTAAAGSVIATSYLGGLVAQANLNIANMGWTQTCAFTSTDLDTVSWAAGVLTTAGGTSYNIAAGNTGNMAARTYIYLDIAVSTIAYQITTTASTAVGIGKILVATAINGAVEATYEVFGGVGGLKVSAVDALVTNSVTAGLISVDNLAAINANLGAITAGTITLPNTGWIKGGQTAYNTGTGFFLGYSTDAYKFSIGNPAGNYMTWNGSAIEMSGKYLDTFTAGENIAAGNVVCLKNSSVTFNATADAEVWSANPTTNYGTSTVMYVGYDNAQSTYRHSLINFDLTTHPSNFQKATLYVYGILVGNMDYTSMRVRLINATWAEGTVTWNTKPTISSGAYGYVNYPTLSTSWSWHAFDVTEALRFAKNGTLNNYGFLFDTTGGTWPAENRYFTMKTKEETGNVGPYIVTLSNELCDEKVYKASQNDYNLSRNVIGFAYESKSTDESIKIQTAGKVSETAVAGTVLYLGNDGAFTTSTANLDRIIILGRGLTSSNLKMNISELDYIGSSRSVSKITGITTYYVAPPNDATKAIITMCNGSGLTLLQTTIYKAGKNDQELRTEANSAIEFNATATWGTNNITLSETLEFSASGYFSISFYNK